MGIGHNSQDILHFDDLKTFFTLMTVMSNKTESSDPLVTILNPTLLARGSCKGARGNRETQGIFDPIKFRTGRVTIQIADYFKVDKMKYSSKTENHIYI
jgi:hypothetical protein